MLGEKLVLIGIEYSTFTAWEICGEQLLDVPRKTSLRQGV